jgi:cytochrome c-type biogenesis protein CcmF
MSSKTVKIKVFIKPMVLWLWIGGGLMGVGTLLSAFPGSRRKPTDATSAPVPSETSA